MSHLLRQNIEKTISLTNDEFEFVLSHFSRRKFKKHQFIVREGDQVDYDYFVVDGLVKAAHINNEGKEHILQFAMEGMWVSDPQAYHRGTKATLNIDCLEDTEVLFISLPNREKLCSLLHKMESFFLQKTTNCQIVLQKRVLCLISSSARERYENLLKLDPALFQRVPKTLIASYLGVTRETLSRLALTQA